MSLGWFRNVLFMQINPFQLTVPGHKDFVSESTSSSFQQNVFIFRLNLCHRTRFLVEISNYVSFFDR